MKKFARALACVISILVTAIGANAADIYMRPDGTDSSNGEKNTPEAAVRTLHRALFVAHKMFKQGESDVRIAVAPGRYFIGDQGPAIIDEQLLQQDDSDRREKRLLIETNGFPDSTARRAIFDGRVSERSSIGNSCAFFVIRARRQSGTFPSISVKGIAFHNMRSPVSIIGDPQNPNRLSGISITGSHFFRIGNKFSCTKDFDFGAIQVSYSNNNVFYGNTFKDIENRSPHEGAVHAIYIKYSSSNNHVYKNIVENSTGSAVKIRDQSDRNIVEGNIFVLHGRKNFKNGMAPPYAVQITHYTESQMASGPECSSYENAIRDNLSIFSPLPKTPPGLMFGYANLGRADKGVPSKCSDRNRNPDAPRNFFNNNQAESIEKIRKVPKLNFVPSLTSRPAFDGRGDGEFRIGLCESVNQCATGIARCVSDGGSYFDKKVGVHLLCERGELQPR